MSLLPARGPAPTGTRAALRPAAASGAGGGRGAERAGGAVRSTAPAVHGGVALRFGAVTVGAAATATGAVTTSGGGAPAGWRRRAVAYGAVQ